MPDTFRRKDITPALRSQVFSAHGRVCRWCGKKAALTSYGTWWHVHIDHIVPVALGGKTVFENLQVLCEICNAIKGNKPPTFTPTIEYLKRVHVRSARRTRLRYARCPGFWWTSPLVSTEDLQKIQESLGYVCGGDLSHAR
jgi:5-methylcytosine-specific restriction endonuclease McrA